jgi:hypothetical protein
MRKSIFVIGAAVGMVACGQSSDNGAANDAAANAAAAEKPKPAYCFFKDAETKEWKAKRDKDGNIVVSGKAFREDSRYKAVLAPATVSGTTAEVTPTITQNDTGFAAPGNWWEVSETLPNSEAVDTVTVRCGDGTVASIKVPRQK